MNIFGKATIFSAIRKGNLAQVKSYLVADQDNESNLESQHLIAANPNLHQVNNAGFTPLGYAIYHDKAHIVALLLKLGAKVNATSKHQQTPLHLASMLSKPNCLLNIINANSNLNAVNQYGETPLITACKYLKNARIVIELLRHGADPSPRDNKHCNALDYLLDNHLTQPRLLTPELIQCYIAQAKCFDEPKLCKKILKIQNQKRRRGLFAAVFNALSDRKAFATLAQFATLMYYHYQESLIPSTHVGVVILQQVHSGNAAEAVRLAVALVSVDTRLCLLIYQALKPQTQQFNRFLDELDSFVGLSHQQPILIQQAALYLLAYLSRWHVKHLQSVLEKTNLESMERLNSYSPSLNL